MTVESGMSRSLTLGNKDEITMANKTERQAALAGTPEGKAAAKAAAKTAADAKKAADKAKVDEKKAAEKAKADEKKAKEVAKKAEAKAKADAKKADAKIKKEAKKAEAAARREAAKQPRVDVAELKVRLKDGAVEGYSTKLKEDELVALATKHSIEIPMKSAGTGIIPTEYRKKYGKTQACGDEISIAFKAAVTVETKGGKDGKKTITSVDPTKLAAVASANKVDLGRWAGKNIGMQRMNLSNVLRGMLNRGENIKIGAKTFKGEKEGTGGKL